MSQAERVPVVQLGADGFAAERFREIVAHHALPLELQAVATSDQEHVGKLLGETSLKTPFSLTHVPVINLATAYNTDAPVIFSTLGTEEAAEYELPLADGRDLLVTTSTANRDRTDTALFNAYVRNGQLSELYGEERPGYILVNGTPMSIPIAIVTAPLHDAIGIESIGIETLQGWSGNERSEVLRGLDDIGAITGGEKERLEAEAPAFLGSMAGPADIRVGEVRPNHAPWVTGDEAKLSIRFNRETSRAELIELLGSVRAPEELKGLSYGEASPKSKPIRLSEKRLIKPAKKAEYKLRRPIKPMKVHAHIIGMDEDGRGALVEISDNNLILGGAGSAVMDIMLAYKKGYLRAEKITGASVL